MSRTLAEDLDDFMERSASYLAHCEAVHQEQFVRLEMARLGLKDSDLDGWVLVIDRDSRKLLRLERDPSRDPCLQLMDC